MDGWTLFSRPRSAPTCAFPSLAKVLYTLGGKVEGLLGRVALGSVQLPSCGLESGCLSAPEKSRCRVLWCGTSMSLAVTLKDTILISVLGQLPLQDIGNPRLPCLGLLSSCPESPATWGGGGVEGADQEAHTLTGACRSNPHPVSPRRLPIPHAWEWMSDQEEFGSGWRAEVLVALELALSWAGRMPSSQPGTGETSRAFLGFISKPRCSETFPEGGSGGAGGAVMQAAPPPSHCRFSVSVWLGSMRSSVFVSGVLARLPAVSGSPLSSPSPHSGPWQLGCLATQVSLTPLSPSARPHPRP